MASWLEEIPPELLHLLVFELGILSPLDVLHLALTSSVLHSALFSTEFDRDQHRALTGVHYCVKNSWVGATLLAISREHGELITYTTFDTNEDVIEMSTFGLAVMNRLVELIQTLLDHPLVDPTENGNYAIRQASKKGYIEIVALLLADPRVDPADATNNAIRLASANGYAEIVELLLGDIRVNPAAWSNTAIRFAAKNGHTETVALLLGDARVDPAAKGNYAIRFAAQNGHTETVALLLGDARVDPAAKNNSAIKIAAQNGYTRTVSLLHSDRRVDVTANDFEAMRLASRNGHEDTVSVMRSFSRTRQRYATPTAHRVIFLATQYYAECMRKCPRLNYAKCKEAFEALRLAREKKNALKVLETTCRASIQSPF